MTWNRFALALGLTVSSLAAAAPHTMTSPPRIDAIPKNAAVQTPAASKPAPAPTPAPPAPTPAAAAPTPAKTGAIQIGMTVPAFSLTVLNNDVAAIKRWGPANDVGDGSKKKLLVMSFFATYCEPCKREMPELARLFAAYKDQGLAVAMVSIDKGDEQKGTILELAKTSGVSFPIVHDRFNVVARRYEADRLPYMILVDSTGKIVAAHVGYTDEVRTGLEAELRGYLGLPKA
jgi:cytochrome c biogenesis protein CcmG, thiol:disulfide interchange protein DsbE